MARVIHWEWLRGLSVAEAEVSGGEAALQRRNPPACVFGHLKGATAYENMRKRERRSRCSSPRFESSWKAVQGG